MILHETRVPAGAVEDGTRTVISVTLPRGEYISAELIYSYNDGEDKTVQMESLSKTTDTETFSAEVEVKTGLYFYFFMARHITKGKTALYKNGSLLERCQLTVYEKGFSTPDFIKGGIMYQIFIDRFNKSGEVVPRDGFYMHENWNETPFYLPDADGITRNEDVYGGNLNGIIEKLDYLKSLNVNVLYLNPVFEANSNHKYNTADYKKIDGMFGTDEDMDRLISKAGELGIKIILDGVFNHTGDDSIYFNRYGKYNSIGAYQSKSSPYYDWYTFKNWNQEYECWWDILSLPTIRKDHPVFRAFICGVNGVIEKWLKRGIAGFRLDVVDELSNKMVRAINRVSKDLSKENIVIGEVWEDASNKIAYGERRSYFLGRQLDSVMNYPIKDAIIRYLKSGDAGSIADALDEIMNNYPPQVIHCLMNVIGTHDTMRILTALGEKEYAANKQEMAKAKLNSEDRKNGVLLMKMAVVLQFTLPGVPCIYYGDEAGMEGYSDPFNRRCYPWGQEDTAMLEFYRKLSKIRTSETAYKEGGYKLICKTGGVYSFSRKTENDEVLTCINLSAEPYHLDNCEYISLFSGKPTAEIAPLNFDILRHVCTNR